MSESCGIIATARSSQPRIFVIGLGTSPAEGVLRRLADETGGAAEFVTPGEAFEAAAQRMLGRMRQPRYTDAAVEWGATPVWQTRLPISVHGGDTVIAFAGFAARTAWALRLLSTDVHGLRTIRCSVDTGTELSGTALARLAAAKWMQQCEPSEAVSIALRHQLLSDQTHCILVHVREAESKATDEAQLHPVTSMLAAGWGGTGTVMATPALSASTAPTVWRKSRGGNSSMDIMFSLAAPEDDDTSVPAFFREPEPEFEEPFATLRELAEFIHAHLNSTANALTTLAVRCGQLHTPDELRSALDEVGEAFAEPALPWLLLAHWVNVRSDGLGDAAMSHALTAPMSRVAPTAVAGAMGVFERSLGLYGLDDWKSSRLRRLARALTSMAA